VTDGFLHRLVAAHTGFCPMKTITIIGKFTVVGQMENLLVLQIADDATVSGLPTQAPAIVQAEAQAAQPRLIDGHPVCEQCDGTKIYQYTKDGEQMEGPCKACRCKGWQTAMDKKRHAMYEARSLSRLFQNDD
jgi:hypothetical protein